MEQCMIFVRTQLDCDNLAAYLLQQGGGGRVQAGKDDGIQNRFSSVVLRGGMSLEERTEALDAFKQGYARFLICTLSFQSLLTALRAHFCQTRPTEL